jgi:cell division protein FtsI/penicillin-binding protein 2
MPDSGELPDAPASTTRLRLLQGAVLALLLILVAGLAHHQIARADVLAQQERRQSQRQILLPAPRGQIFDREHRLLAGTRFRTALVLDLGPLRSSLLTEARGGDSTRVGEAPSATRSHAQTFRRAH